MKKEEFLNILSNYKRWSELNVSPIFHAIITELFDKIDGLPHQTIAFNVVITEGIQNDKVNAYLIGSEMVKIHGPKDSTTYKLSIEEIDDDIEVRFTVDAERYKLTNSHQIKSRRLSTIKEEFDKEGHHTDYQENIEYFDENYKPLKVNVEDELDKSFSEHLYIPISSARQLRTDFKKNREKILNLAIQTEMQENDESAEFMPPITLEELPQVMRYSDLYDYDDICSSVDDCCDCHNFEECVRTGENTDDTLDVDIDEIIEYLKSNKEEQKKNEESKVRIRNLIRLLSQKIPTNIPLVFSVGMFMNLDLYVIGETRDFLETTGEIISKVDDELIIYQVYLSKDTVVVYQRENPMSQEEIDKLEEQGLISSNKLREFFSTGRSI